MNNFRNPYVDTDSFQGETYDNNVNPTNSDSIHFSIKNQGEFHQKETQQSPKNSQYNKIEKAYITKSKPLMFSPPKVESIQLPVIEDQIDELSFDIAKSKNSKNEKMDKKELVSSLTKEFSHMLENASSIYEQLPILQEGKFEDDSTLNLDGISGEQVHTKHRNPEMLFAKFNSMLDVRNDDLLCEGDDIKLLDKSNDTMEDKFFSQLSESESESEELQEESEDSDTNEKDILQLNEKNDTTEDKFLGMLSESDELQEEKQDSLFKETNSNKMGDLFKGKFHLCYKKPSFQKKEIKYCINKNNRHKIAGLKEGGVKRVFQKNIHPTVLIEKKKTTTVKMQVLLTKLETDVDIVKTMDFVMPIDNILKVDWSIQSLDCKVVIPSKTVLLKGEFVAEIEFSNKKLDNKIQLLKISIPWSKTVIIDWLSTPDISYSSRNEFMFKSQHEHDPSCHYESYNKFAEPVHSLLNQINFVWYQEFNSKDKQLLFNGVAQLSIHFMQEQFVKLECYSK